MDEGIVGTLIHVDFKVLETHLGLAWQKIAFGSFQVGQRILFAETDWDGKLIDGFFEILQTGKTYSSQVKIFGQVLLSLFDADVDVLHGVFEWGKVQLQDGAVVK